MASCCWFYYSGTQTFQSVLSEEIKRSNRIRSIPNDANVYLLGRTGLWVATKQECASSHDFVLKSRRRTLLFGCVPRRKQSHSLPIRNLHQASYISLLPVECALERQSPHVRFSENFHRLFRSGKRKWKGNRNGKGTVRNWKPDFGGTASLYRIPMGTISWWLIPSFKSINLMKCNDLIC